MNIISLLFHIIIDFLIGFGVLQLLNKKEQSAEHYFLALLLGFLIETTAGFWLLWVGLPLNLVAIALILLAIGLNIKNGKVLTAFFKQIGTGFKTFKNIKWYEWILWVLILEKIVVVIWQLLRMPTYHSDSVRHWAIQARALYGGVNWSMESGADFLAKKFFVVADYPLQVTVWRAIGATYNMGWDDFVSRSDGLIFYIIVCGLTGVLFAKFTQKRWIGLGAAFVVASLPLQIWQSASGYTDIAVEAYLLAAVATFIRKEWLLCGLFMAGTMWSKNEGFAIYVPSMVLAGLIYILLVKEEPWKKRLRVVGQFLSGLALIFPWLIFQIIHGTSALNRVIKPLTDLLSDNYSNDFSVVLVQTGKKFQNATPSYQLLWEYVLTGSSHGIFWIVSLLGVVLLGKFLIKDRIGRSLLGFLIAVIGINYYIFTYTPAYEFLMIQTTVHRVFLQIYAATLAILGYGISLYLKERPLDSESVVVLVKKNSSKKRK